MATKRFSDQPAAAALTGAEVVPVTQSGSDVQTTAQAVANLAWVNGDKGDITVGGVAGSVLTIDNNAVTYAKMQDVSATDRLLGRSTSGAGDVEEITCTAQGRALIDDTSAAAQRVTLGILQPIVAACSDETTALTTGTKITFRNPYATVYNVTAVKASLSTAQASGSIFTVDINESGTTILSTKITIDNTEKTSTTAAIQPVISDASIAADAEITIDIDQVGDGTAKGLKVTLIGYPS